MKKPIIIAVAALAAAGAFATALIVVTNMRGGLDPSRNGIKKVPLLGALVKVRAADPPGEAKEPDAAAPAEETQKGNMSFLRFGAQSRLTELADELEAKKAEYRFAAAGVPATRPGAGGLGTPAQGGTGLAAGEAGEGEGGPGRAAPGAGRRRRRCWPPCR